MGGEASGCTEETTDVFVEAACWDHVHIAAAGRALKINSDARYRNERGIDPAFNLPGLEAATQMILDICGGEASEVVQAGGGARRRPRLPAGHRADRRASSAWTIPARPSSADLTGSASGSRTATTGAPAHLAARHAGRGRPGRGGRARRLADQASGRADAARRGRRAGPGPDAAAAARAGGGRRARGARLQRVRHLLLHRPGRGARCSAAGRRGCGWRTRSRPR